jgi:hypothetical protein
MEMNINITTADQLVEAVRKGARFCMNTMPETLRNFAMEKLIAKELKLLDGDILATAN